jgi:2-aminoadipate transaminase
VPGAAFFADHAKANTLRLSFVTVPPEEIERGVMLLAQTLAETLKETAGARA